MKRRLLSRSRRFYKNIWLRGVFPQIDIYRDDERAVAEAAFDEVWFTRWYPWYLVVILTLPFGAAQMLIATLGAGVVSSPWLVAAIVVVGLPAGIAVTIAIDILFMFFIRSLLQRNVRIALRRKGYDVCLECGYLLFGLSPGMTQCPECGAQRAPSAGQKQP